MLTVVEKRTRHDFSSAFRMERPSGEGGDLTEFCEVHMKRPLEIPADDHPSRVNDVQV